MCIRKQSIASVANSWQTFYRLYNQEGDIVDKPSFDGKATIREEIKLKDDASPCRVRSRATLALFTSAGPAGQCGEHLQGQESVRIQHAHLGAMEELLSFWRIHIAELPE